MEGVPYFPDDGELIFREPFPKIRNEPMRTLYIRAIVDGTTEQEWRTRKNINIFTIMREIREHKKILNAKAVIKSGRLIFVAHSPQLDFLEEVTKCEK